MQEKIPFERYLACDGLAFSIGKQKYTIRAKLRNQKYPYVRDYVDLSAEYKQQSADYPYNKTWFLDLIQSESDTCNKLFLKMEKWLAKQSEIE